ncbi:MAG TPA: hypothetical protein VFW60_09360 [Rhodanobacteraceae bacterium]|nr:hypothetical protein [Rhodanobacteraceae bacterium]
MENPFFEHPILNSPYEYPKRYWELDGTGQPTQQIIDSRRPADFVTPIPKPRRQQGQGKQGDLALGNDAGLSTENQQYAQAAIIRQVREQVDRWRLFPEAQSPLPHHRKQRRAGTCAGRTVGQVGNFPASRTTRVGGQELQRTGTGFRVGRHRQDHRGTAPRGVSGTSVS